PPEQSTSKTVTSVVTMEVDIPSNIKSKESKTLEDTHGKSPNIPLNINKSFDASKNFWTIICLQFRHLINPKYIFTV
ncbi:18224_t:CDS:1, partial [Funneliformis geosporum]